MSHQSPNTLDKPILDEGAFQQLLAAAYTLQEEQHHRRIEEPIEKPKIDSLQTAPVRTLSVGIHQPSPVSSRSDSLTGVEQLKARIPVVESAVQPMTPFKDLALLPAPRVVTPETAPPLRTNQKLKGQPWKSAKLAQPAQRGIPVPANTLRRGILRTPAFQRPAFQSNGLFWRAATVVAIAALGVLLLSAAVNRFSPLPAGLTQSPKVVQQVPFQGQPRTETAMPPSAPESRTLPSVEADSKAATNQNEREAQPAVGIVTSATPSKTTVPPNHRSVYESEADVVAPDTVVRYSTRPIAPHAQARNGR